MPLSMEEANKLRETFYHKDSDPTVKRILALPAKSRKMMLLCFRLNEKGEHTTWGVLDQLESLVSRTCI